MGGGRYKTRILLGSKNSGVIRGGKELGEKMAMRHASTNGDSTYKIDYRTEVRYCLVNRSIP